MVNEMEMLSTLNQSTFIEMHSYRVIIAMLCMQHKAKEDGLRGQREVNIKCKAKQWKKK